MNRLETPPDAAGQRLDVWLAQARPEHSRARWQQLIRDGHVRTDDAPRKPNHTLRGGECVSWDEPPPVDIPLVAEDIPLDILYEDDQLLVVNKPPGLVAHPAPGHAAGTLVNALLHHCGDLTGIGGAKRPGLVHRLDKDTSGALVIAKTEPTLRALIEQFREREVGKIYLALVWGHPAPPFGVIRTLIGRHPHHRQKMSADGGGRPSVTHYETLETFREIAALQLRLETGRTHQIRVHLKHIGHPVIGDPTYGFRRLPRELPTAADRQMLHAHRLTFRHPATGRLMEFVAPLPDDFRRLLAALRAERVPASPAPAPSP